MSGKKSIWDRILGKIIPSRYRDPQSLEGQIAETENYGPKSVMEEHVEEKNTNGARCLEEEKAFIRTIETDYSILSEQEFYQKYRERFFMGLVSGLFLVPSVHQRKQQRNFRISACECIGNRWLYPANGLER